MKLSHILLTALAGVAMTATSCSDSNDPDTVTEQTYNLCFNNVQDVESGLTANYKGVTYKISTNYSQSTVDLEIMGLQTPQGQYPAMTLKDIKWKQDGLYRVAEAKQVVPVSNGFASLPTFYNVKFVIADRMLTDKDLYVPVISLTYNVDMKYNVTVIPNTLYYYGYATSTAGSALSFTNPNAWYQVEFYPEASTVDLTLGNAQFMQQQPAMDMIFKALPFTVEDGDVKFAMASFDPYIGATPFPAYPITDFQAVCEIDDDIELSFKCTPGNATVSGITFDVVGEGSVLPTDL